MGVLPISLSKRRACVVVLRGDSHLCNDKKKKSPPKQKDPLAEKEMILFCLWVLN